MDSVPGLIKLLKSQTREEFTLESHWTLFRLTLGTLELAYERQDAARIRRCVHILAGIAEFESQICRNARVELVAA